ncbi:MAG: ParA family protein [Coriobacteriaceae bacterium]|nr:ParA family protein [Coriobacteriaceae bacterium]
MIISIINLKGGVGKTTTAMALATAAQRDGKDVEVYDTDPQSSASLWAMSAEESGDALPFPVVSANIATVRLAERKRKGDPDKWVVIDCPPNGHVMDEAMRVADMVIVPTTTGPADMVKAFETAETLSSRGIYYAILMTRTVARTLTLRQSLSELEERRASYFDAQIPNREALKNFFGNSFGDDLFGYEGVYEEAKEGLEDGD